MIETYYAGSYWLARPESAEACAYRAEHFFRSLERCDPAWNRWYPPADSFEQARKRQFTPNAASFQKLFAQQKHQSGEGFSFRLWTGESPEETSSAGASCGSAESWLPSNCVLTPFDEGPVGERVLTASVMTDVLRSMSVAWEPEWAVATSHQHLEMLAQQVIPPGTFVGWVMYFSRLRGTVPPLPAPVRIEPLEDKGTLVILTPERFSASNPEHVALAARVHELLKRAGLLRPLQPWPA
ncbi:immunity 52 family protein [Hyalangium rubrum]|uniref:Immunity 52 family protein n=1 Tax=Hyalangium rubrum TaxID=3103134 RepID=A0ABU5HFI6_9BACT|nr:immunity 52 family protein [Hyalangium sp. s54d21]MDY7232121.1 immunity 52 family protein [Hyalangium sp. s54d21]